MRTLLWLILGFGLAFAAGIFALSAGALAAIGVASHVLLRREPGMVDVLSFDPSTMVSRAPLPAGVAILFVVAFAVVARRLRSEIRARSRSV